MTDTTSKTSEKVVADPTPTKTKEPVTKEFVATNKFGYSGGTAKAGDIVSLTSKEAKHLNKYNAIAPYIPDEDDEDE